MLNRGETSPSARGPLRVAVLSSRRAPGLGGRAVIDGRFGPDELPADLAAPRRAAGY